MRKTRQLGRYQIMERIAYGGMAEIFRGMTFDEHGFQKDVAVKKVLPHFAEDRSFVDMLRDEYRLVSFLKHPNIAEVYELAQVGDAILISMEFVDGKDLRSVVERAKQTSTPFELDDLVYVVARALDGLHHAHVAKDHTGRFLELVHRDFSPSNILVGYDGQVKICDFGIAKAADNRVQTKTGIIKGKVKYMSPEQAFGRKLDARSDLFSAGSVLYELVTGQAPFNAPNEVDLIFAVRDAVFRPVLEAAPNVPPALAQLIERSMVRSRSGRFQSALEFRDALLGFLKQHNPGYRRTKLANFMKRIWREQIEVELRAMEEYIISAEVNGELGRNLIADAMGEDAQFSKFSPQPTRTTSAGDAPEVDAVHQARTEILDAPRGGKRRPRRVPLTAHVEVDEDGSTAKAEKPGDWKDESTLAPLKKR